jgi:peptidyl-prolyl cis-trans isomerase C
MNISLYRSRSVILATALALCLVACAKTDLSNGNADSPKVATVNGKPITKEMFDAYVDAVTQGQGTQLTDAQRDQVLDQLVLMQLTSEYADLHGAKTDKKLQARIELSRLNTIMEDTLKTYASQHPASDTEVKAEYDNYVASLGSEYHARHILVATQAEAQDIIAKLKSGADFAKLATQKSTDGSAKQGGDLGWFGRASMVKPFSDAVATLEKGQITQQPVQTQFGWHVIKLEDTRSPTPAAFEEVKDKAKASVERKKVMAFADELKKAATIEKIKPAEAVAAPVVAPAAAKP